MILTKQDLEYKRDTLADIECWLEGYIQDRECFLKEFHIDTLKNCWGVKSK